MPFNVLDADIVNQLNVYSAAAEAAGQLTPEQLSIVLSNRWFKLFVPEKFGGLAHSLPDGLRLEEDIARIDGSLGWTVTLCAGANLFAGYIDPAFAEKIFYADDVCLGGSGAVAGTADVLEDGYILNGKWKFATGAPHLSHFTVNCRLQKNGDYITDEKNLPIIRSFIFTKDEVVISKDWEAMGLKATASHSFEANDIKVGKERMFLIDPEHCHTDDPVCHYPFLQFAETTLAVNTLGMTKHFLDEARNMMSVRLQKGRTNKEVFDIAINRINFAANFMDKNKEHFYAKVEQSWRQLTENSAVEPATLDTISFLSKGMAKAARELVIEIFPLCGLAAAENKNTINRIFRDVFTASQHSLLAV